MTFGGTFGAGGNPIPINLMVALVGDLSSNPDGASVDLTLFGNTQVIPAPTINNLTIFAFSAPTPLLEPFIAAGTPADLDHGSLTTAVPGATEHGLPANFGPGRGNWNFNNLLRLRARIAFFRSNAAADTDIGQTVVQGAGITGVGDLLIEFRNISLAQPLEMIIELEYRHSIGIS